MSLGNCLGISQVAYVRQGIAGIDGKLAQGECILRRKYFKLLYFKYFARESVSILKYTSDVTKPNLHATLAPLGGQD